MLENAGAGIAVYSFCVRRVVLLEFGLEALAEAGVAGIRGC